MKRHLGFCLIPLLAMTSLFSCASNDHVVLEYDCVVSTYRGGMLRYFPKNDHEYLNDLGGPIFFWNDKASWSYGLEMAAGDCYTLVLDLSREVYEKGDWTAVYLTSPATISLDHYVTSYRKKEIEIVHTAYLLNEDFDFVDEHGNILDSGYFPCDDDGGSFCNLAHGPRCQGKYIEEYDVGTAFDIISTPLLPGVQLGISLL